MLGISAEDSPRERRLSLANSRFDGWLPRLAFSFFEACACDEEWLIRLDSNNLVATKHEGINDGRREAVRLPYGAETLVNYIFPVIFPETF
jgi:hypothetical protein